MLIEASRGGLRCVLDRVSHGMPARCAASFTALPRPHPARPTKRACPSGCASTMLRPVATHGSAEGGSIGHTKRALETVESKVRGQAPKHSWGQAVAFRERERERACLSLVRAGRGTSEKSRIRRTTRRTAPRKSVSLSAGAKLARRWFMASMPCARCSSASSSVTRRYWTRLACDRGTWAKRRLPAVPRRDCAPSLEDSEPPREEAPRHQAQAW